MKSKKVKTSALLMMPPLALWVATLQAADLRPAWEDFNHRQRGAAAVTGSTLSELTATLQAADENPVKYAPAAAVAPPARTAAVAGAPAAGATTEAAEEQPAQAAAPADNDSTASPAENGMSVSTVITPRLFAYDYFEGGGDNLPHYLERYDYRDGLTGDNRSGVDADIDLSLIMNDGDRDVFVIERQGFGQNTHRGMARLDDDEITFSGSYSHYRSATGGLDYLFSPAVVPGAGIAPFPGGAGTISPGGNLPFTSNTGTTEYRIDRTAYAAGFKMKPSLLGGSVSVAVDYTGYKREGNQLASPLVMAGGGGPAAIDSWRGINLAVDESMKKLGFSLSASPGKLFNVAYDVSMEKFSNQAPDLVRNDLLGTTGDSRQDLAPFYFVPDTTLVTQGLRVSKNIGERAVLAAGYSYATLEQDNFPDRFTTPHGGQTDPYTQGEINNQSGYLTASANVSSTIGVEGHIKYHNRENDSSFPVPHVIAPGGASPRMTGPRINSIESMDYGVAANWRPGVMRSSLTLGWQRIDRQRDLTYRLDGEGIPPERILYREDSLSDEVYLKWIARPAAGFTLRLSPSYSWADKVGLVTEPEQALKVKTMLSYASPSGWLASAYYDYKHKQNDGLSYVGTGGSTVTQDVDDTFHSAGVSFNVMPRETINTSLSLFWTQNDFESFFFSTDNPRFANSPSVAFLSAGPSTYKIDSYGLTLGADWQTNEKLKLSGSYTLTQNKGDTASGEVLLALQAATGTIDSRIDNTLHSISLGADYTLTPKTTLRANYIYDYYDDSAYDLLTGGVNMLAVGVSFSM